MDRFSDVKLGMAS